MSDRTVSIIDTTMRDGFQSLWSWRMTGDKVLPIATEMDNAGFEAIDWGSALHMQISIKYLNENPFKRLRAIRQKITKTPLISHVRGRSIASFGTVPNSVIELTVERMAANGISRFMVFDPLHDVNNLNVGIRAARKAGLETSVVIFYTISPLHTDEYYKTKAAELASLDVDSICLRDPSGLLTLERVQSLIPTIREAIGNKPFQIKSHCLTGLAPKCYIEAIKNGVDSIFTASWPLANGPSVPSHEDIVKEIKKYDYHFTINERKLLKIADFFYNLAKKEDKPIGKIVSKFDPAHYDYQVPGGMMSFLKDQLREMKQEAKLNDVLKEIPKVRQDLGYPVMVTPLSQVVGAQAVLNVITGERYSIIPDEIKKFVLGYYGNPEMPIDNNLINKIGDEEHLKSEFVQKQNEKYLDNVRKEYGPFDSDDELLLYALFPAHLIKNIS